MAEERAESSLVIQLETIKQQIGKDEAMGFLKPTGSKDVGNSSKRVDKSSKKKMSKNARGLIETESFRNATENIIPVEELFEKLEVNQEYGLIEKVPKSRLSAIDSSKLSEIKISPWYCVLLRTVLKFFSGLLWISPLPETTYLLSIVIFKFST